MQCPTCVKLGLPPSYFCAQACFKAAWGQHKLKHSVTASLTPWQKVLLHRPEFRDFEFTGPLRPWPLSPPRTVPPHIARPDYADHPEGEPLSEREAKSTMSIPIYTAEEIAGIREACKVSAEVLAEAAKIAKPGVTTDEIDRVVHDACIERNCYPSPLNYRGFPKSVCTSINEVICHGIPDMRELQDGDICNLDVSCYLNGFHGDVNETLLIGNVAPQHAHLVQTAHECLNLAIAAVKPNMLYRDLGNIITAHATKNGFSVVRSFCGHGVGRLFHCLPNVPHYAKNKAIGTMKPGHIFTIEPMINEGVWQDELWPDEWTAVTRDGKRSAQFEHTLLVTDTGCEVLTKRPFGSYIDRF